MVARIPAEETTRFVNRYTDGQREQTVEAVAEPIVPDILLPDWRHPEIVHLAPLVNELRPDAVQAFPRSFVGVTPQGWLRCWGEDGIVRAKSWDSAELVLARADAVVLSEQDVADPSELDRLAQMAKLLVVTRGERGSSVYPQGAAPAHIAAYVAARETDPTGAGDVFAAAFFIHYLSTKDPVDSADFASCTASFVVEKKAWSGIPTPEQVHDRRRKAKRHALTGPLV
jgi:sugar/nucleoside kinase (ribokinase family)